MIILHSKSVFSKLYCSCLTILITPCHWACISEYRDRIYNGLTTVLQRTCYVVLVTAITNTYHPTPITQSLSAKICNFIYLYKSFDEKAQKIVRKKSDCINYQYSLSVKSFILSFFHIFLRGGMSGAKKTHKYILLNNNIYL